jgi:hypothetical protein
VTGKKKITYIVTADIREVADILFGEKIEKKTQV